MSSQLQEQLDKAADTLRENKETIEGLQKSNHKLAQTNRFACERVVLLEQELTEARERFSKTDESSFKIMANAVTKYSDEAVALQDEIERLKTVNAAFSATNTELVASILDVRRELEESKDLVRELRRQTHIKNGELHAKDLQISRLESELAIAQARYEGASQERAELRRDMEAYGYETRQESGLAIGDTAPVDHEGDANGAVAQRAGRS